jgi:hypothetical protein
LPTTTTVKPGQKEGQQECQEKGARHHGEDLFELQSTKVGGSEQLEQEHGQEGDNLEEPVDARGRLDAGGGCP